ncbi:TIGR01212 family radical SAM protein [Kiritimatiellaeota bacterium B1221]|nr:TIGR01212 family radical SAM protein [Kiritimatiellaeota bacterium B1221]
MESSSFPWLSHKEWAVQRWGEPLYRVPVDPGWGCPHKKPGEIGGCSFCAEDGGRARQTLGADSPAGQVAKGMAFARERYGEGKLELYIQAYTATFSSVDALKALIEPLLEANSFVSLSLGTRPDCLPPASLELLLEWNQHLDVWVELGLQTAQDATLLRINRQHSWAKSKEAVYKLQEAGLNCCAHLLFGLPGETSDEMFATVEEVVALPVQALKLHNLHVIEGSILGEQFKQQPFPVLSESAWLELVMQLIRRIPADLPLFRVFTDSEHRLAPKSEFSKGAFLHQLEGTMRERGWFQGEL